MAKKGGKKGGATDVTNASAADNKIIDEEKKVEDTDDKSEKIVDITQDTVKQSAAGGVDKDEEEKVDVTEGKGLKRSNSRI